MAITPTLTSLSMMLPRSFISRIWLTNSQQRINTMTPVNTLIDCDSFISR